MKISDLARLIDAMYHSPARRSLYVEGPPGIGKSAACAQAAARNGLAFLAWNPNLHDPVDLSGVPSVVNGRTRWNAPDWVPSDPDSQGILCIEELPQAEPALQKACASVLLERKVGDTPLPPGWMVVANGNRGKDRAGAGRLYSHVANRMVRVELEVSNDDWQQWAVEQELHRQVRGYLRFQASDLFDFDPSRDAPNATPRSWHMASDLLPTVPEDLRHPAVAGCVGEGIAAKFCAYCRMEEKLPDIDAHMKSPDTCKLPSGEQLDVLWAYLTAVGERCRDGSPKTTTAALTIALRVPVKFDEFSLMLVKDVWALGKGAWKQSPRRADVLKRHKTLLLGD